LEININIAQGRWNINTNGYGISGKPPDNARYLEKFPEIQAFENYWIPINKRR